MAIDPVCGMRVDEKKAEFKLEYKGKVYYFCSKHCLEEFSRNPEKYVKGGAAREAHEHHHHSRFGRRFLGIEVHGTTTHTVVVFGEESVYHLGVVTLEELGLEVDPIKDEPRPMELLLITLLT